MSRLGCLCRARWVADRVRARAERPSNARLLTSVPNQPRNPDRVPSASPHPVPAHPCVG